MSEYDHISSNFLESNSQSQIKILKLKISELERREKKNISDLKTKFSELYQKFKDEINKKIEIKNDKISKLKIKINQQETEMKTIIFTTTDKQTKEKNQLETVILKQEELIENLYKKNENLSKTLNQKNQEYNLLKNKLKDEEIINRKNYNGNSLPLSPESLKNNNHPNNILTIKEHNKDLLNISKSGEVEYFKNLNKNLQEQIIASEKIIKTYEVKITQITEELDQLKSLRQKFEKFEHSYIENFKKNEVKDDQGEKTLNFENTVNDEEYNKEQQNNINNLLITENNEMKLNISKNPNDPGLIVNKKNLISKNQNNIYSISNIKEDEQHDIENDELNMKNESYEDNKDNIYNEEENCDEENEQSSENDIDSKDINKNKNNNKSKHSKISKNEIYGRSFRNDVSKISKGSKKVNKNDSGFI